jgi:hypothetical protein
VGFEPPAQFIQSRGLHFDSSWGAGLDDANG